MACVGKLETLLGILVTTFVPKGAELRLRAIQQTADSWKKFMKYDGKFHIHVADDGSDPLYNYEYWRSVYLSNWPSAVSFSYSRQERQGVGASLNRGFDACFEYTPLVFYGADDWSLLNTINITPWAEILMEYDDIGCVRLGVSSPFLRGGEMVRYKDIWAIKFEKYSYIWCQRPALYHKRFIQSYGAFPEMEKATEVDRIWNDIVLTKEGPDVVLALLHPWQHLWSIEQGDIVPPDNIPSERLSGEIPFGTDPIHTGNLPSLLS